MPDNNKKSIKRREREKESRKDQQKKLIRMEISKTKQNKKTDFWL